MVCVSIDGLTYSRFIPNHLLSRSLGLPSLGQDAIILMLVYRFSGYARAL
jgi:hypothetical protein